MSNNRITWEDFKRMNTPYEVNITKVPTDIECPKCHVLRLWKRVDKVLLSNPPQYQYECACGWIGYHTL